MDRHQDALAMSQAGDRALYLLLDVFPVAAVKTGVKEVPLRVWKLGVGFEDRSEIARRITKALELEQRAGAMVERALIAWIQG